MDILIGVLLVAGFALGFFRGAVRQLLALGVWLVAFLVAAYGRPPVGEWLGVQWPQFTPRYVEFVAFGLLFVVLLGLGVLIAEVAGARITLSRHEWVDDVIGGLLGAGLVLLSVASLIVIMDTGYERSGRPSSDIGWVRDAYVALSESELANRIEGSLIVGLDAVLGPLLPEDVRLAMR
jgi:membrane protein required for colicin V production